MLPNLPYKFTACAPRNVDNFRSTLSDLKKTILPSLAEDDVSELPASCSKALSHRSCDLGISPQESILSDVVPLSPSGNSVGGSCQGEQSSSVGNRQVQSDKAPTPTIRKSGRVRQPRKMYDPETGSYVLPSS